MREKIQIEPAPVGVGYLAVIPGTEDRYGIAYGETPDQARQQLLEQIEEAEWWANEFRLEWKQDAK